MTENGVIDSCPSLHPLLLPGDDRKVICEFMETASREPPGDDRHCSGSSAWRTGRQGQIPGMGSHSGVTLWERSSCPSPSAFLGAHLPLWPGLVWPGSLPYPLTNRAEYGYRASGGLQSSKCRSQECSENPHFA